MSLSRSYCLALAVSLALVPIAAATPVNPPNFYAYAYTGACPSNTNIPPVVDEGASPTFATITSTGTVYGWPAYYTGTAEAEAGSPPWVRSDSVAENLQGPTCPNRALAELRYEADLTPIAPSVPVTTPIPVTITSFGSVTCRADPPPAPIAGSLVIAKARVDEGAWGGFAEVSCDGDELPPGLEDEFFGSWSGTVYPLQKLPFHIVVETKIQIGTGGAEAYADPTIEIDPSFMIEYEGQMVPATSLYTIEFSEGVLPEPTNGAPFALGVLGLLARWRRRRLCPG